MHIINTINNINHIISYLQQLPIKQDPSILSLGRLTLWINKEPSFQLKEDCLKLAKPTYVDSFITALCDDLVNFKVDYILVSYSGDTASGIDWHRDSYYLDTLVLLAATINLGDCKFGVKEDNKQEQWLDLVGGEVITFNCKHYHCAIPSPNRWAIHCWQDSGK